MNSTRLITSELATRRARKALFTCVVYTNIYHCRIWLSPVLAQARTFCASNRIRTWLHPPPAHWRIENVCCLNPSFPIGKWDDENNHEIKKVWACTHLITPNPQVPSFVKVPRMLTNVILWVRDWSKSIGGVVGPEQRGWLIGFECLVRVDRLIFQLPIFNLHLWVGHSMLYQMEGMGRVFSNRHILKCSVPRTFWPVPKPLP